MPTILRQDGFAICINTDDHEPLHVHVYKAGIEAKINIGDEKTRPSARAATHMKVKDLRKALELVAEHQERLVKAWEAIHG